MIPSAQVGTSPSSALFPTWQYPVPRRAGFTTEDTESTARQSRNQR